MTITKASLNQAEKITERLVVLLGFEMKCTVSADLNGLKIDLKCEDGSLLIGYHGESLAAFACLVTILPNL